MEANYSFTLGFIFGSVFNLFVIWIIQQLFFPKNKELTTKKLTKEFKKMKNKEPQELKDLSLTINNLHVEPHHKEQKSSFLYEKQNQN